jgi:hypothetical protein
MSIQKYPIGLQDFREVITRGCVYVDKTMFVHKLLTTHKYYFLSRPRRFGKSLLISTLDYLFRGQKELFEGLYIYNQWEFDEYPVIKISFANIGYREIPLEDAILKHLKSIAVSYKIEIDLDSVSIAFRDLIHQLYQKFDKKVVVLIDEYDKPLIDYLDKENLHKAIGNRAILKSFYSILKDADPYLKLVFITGVSKFSQVSIFSDLNNLNDITTQEVYNEVCGISQQELESYFSEELETFDKVKVKEWYNGYRWDENANTVYNPFSILGFFNNGGKYVNFWYSTGTPTFLMKKSREERFYQFENLTYDLNDLQSFDIESLKVIPILFQTGYLTITGKDTVLNTLKLDFPNREVKESYLRNLADLYIESDVLPTKAILGKILEALRLKNEKELAQSINLAFAQIPYDLWQKENEHFYHAIVHLLFSLLGLYIESEVHTQHGRADIIIHYENNVYCMEFKLDKSADEAIQQINERGYLDKYTGTDKTLHKIGINFSSADKKVEHIIWV